MSRIPACVASVPIFRVMPPDGLEELAGSLHHRHYDKGEVVAVAGDPILDLMVVARGRLKLAHSSASGRTQVVRALEAGDFVGEMALFSPARHEGELVAAEATDVCMVPRQAVQAILRKHPEVAVRLVESLAERLASAEQLAADLSLRDVGQRLAAELLRASGGGTALSDGMKVRIPIPWAEVALKLGTTPESLSRRLKAMAEDGIIRQEGSRTVVIRSVEWLREMAEG